MASSSSSSNSQPSLARLTKELTEAARKAYEPPQDPSTYQEKMREFGEFIARTDTRALLPAMSTLMQQKDTLPPWLSTCISQALESLPLKHDGVRASMEFIFSNHPSTNNSSQTLDAATQRQGGSITHEAVAVATTLFSAVPGRANPQWWFMGLSSQFFDLLDGNHGPDLARTAAQIIGFGMLGKKRFGAPGAPGWNVFAQPMIQFINPSLRSLTETDQDSRDGGEVIDLSRGKVLVSSDVLGCALQRLKILILSNPSPGLCSRLMKHITPQIFALASWPNVPRDNAAALKDQEAARALMDTYLRLFGKPQTILFLIHKAACKGSDTDNEDYWEYRVAEQGGMEAVALHYSARADLCWDEIDVKLTCLVNMIMTSCSAEHISSAFLILLRGWIKIEGEASAITLPTSSAEQKEKGFVQRMLEATILPKFLEMAPEKLVSHFDQLLEVICQVLKADHQVPQDDGLVELALSLLNLVITAPTFKKTDINPDELAIVETSLTRLSQQDREQLSQTASNLSLLMKYRGDLDVEDEVASKPSSSQIEDRKTYNLAMNYITGADNPPPVVSEGLDLLSGLVNAGSSVLDITAVTVLMSNLLTNNEDYINLRVIKMFTQLANKHPKTTINELVDHYVDAQEKESTDTRLRFGEALLQVIQRLGETFSGEVSRQVAESLLATAGRRGYRPKTEAKQKRKERVRIHKQKQTRMNQAAEDDRVLDDPDDPDEPYELLDDYDKIFAQQIVQGWESKRGAEDIRMRASALSIFGSALETNISGVGPSLASAGVDLCIHTLALEPEIEKSILRRAAVMAICSFIVALQRAWESGRQLGFDLTASSRQDMSATLEYIADTDIDGLVRQHARDVTESLDNWQLSRLVPKLSPSDETGLPGLDRLAGLQINPGSTSNEASGQTRPKIEEVE